MPVVDTMEYKVVGKVVNPPVDGEWADALSFPPSGVTESSCLRSVPHPGVGDAPQLLGWPQPFPCQAPPAAQGVVEDAGNA